MHRDKQSPGLNLVRLCPFNKAFLIKFYELHSLRGISMLCMLSDGYQ